MASYRQLVKPNLGVQVSAGWCLALVRIALNVPAWDARASHAADKTRHRHTSRVMPNAIVPVWFSHWGTYGSGAQQETGEFGHVVLWVPGKGFLSSPGYGYGSEWLATLDQIEARFRCRYRFWSEDMGGVRIVQPVSSPTTPVIETSDSPEEGTMKPIVIQRTEGRNEWTRIHPTIGRDLEPGKKRTGSGVTVFYGYEATTDRTRGEAWARMHSDGSGAPHQRLNRAQYVAVQREARRLAQFHARAEKN